MTGDSSQRLRAENRRLRRRLAEAEQALEAIHRGEVDSLVVEGADGPRIFSLEGVNHSYRVLVEAMNEGAATLGEEGLVLYCNARFARLLDTPLERVMGAPLRDWVPADSRPTFDALLRQGLEGESRAELRLLASDGPAPVQLSACPVVDQGRRVLCLVATDLREQKRNQEIVAAERLACSVLDQAADAIIVCDQQGRIIRANQAASALCGGNPLLAAFGEAFALSFPSPHLAAAGNDGAAIALRGETLRAVPAELRRAGGSRVEVLVSAAALHGDGGQIIGCVVALVDVTEHRRAEEALRQSEEHFRILAEALPPLVWTADAAGRVDFANSRWQELTGLAPATVVERGWNELLHPDDAGRVAEAWEQVVRQPQRFQIECRLRRLDGAHRWFLARAYPLCGEADQVVRWFGTFTDIHELKEAQRELDQANQRKSEFLGMLSHELRNPLSPICNSVYILGRAAPGSEQAQRALSVIDRQVKHITRLVDDLLDVTRISRGKIRLNPEPLELRELVASALEDHRALFAKGGVELESALGDDPLPIRGDRTRLLQVVGNLLSNAGKFTPRRGRAQIALEREAASHRARIRVRDTGVGIDPEMLGRLFEPFAQAERTLDRSRGGLGLGLTLVRGLVELHGGSVQALSQGPGHGSEFVVELPLAVAPSPVSGEPRPPPARDRTVVLVIEDNLDAGQTLVEVLQLGGHQAHLALDGQTGIARARELRPDLVLCDIGLPDMSGFDVARALRADEALRATCLVALSGYTQPEHQQEAAAAGFDAHLPKPAPLDRLNGLLAARAGKTRLRD